MHFSRLIPITSFALGAMLMLTSCGDDSSGDSSSDAGTGDASSGTVLGERGVPGYTLRATRMATTNTAAIRIRITIVPEAQQPMPTSVACWIAHDFDHTAVAQVALPVTDTIDEFTVTLMIPPSLPAESAVWVRITLPDGTVQEVGRASFQL